jgi:hypothetical protein
VALSGARLGARPLLRLVGRLLYLQTCAPTRACAEHDRPNTARYQPARKEVQLHRLIDPMKEEEGLALETARHEQADPEGNRRSSERDE